MPLDPNQFAQLVNIYATEIDSLINTLGKNVTLYFEDTVTVVNDEFNDPIHGGTRKPSYKETASNPEPVVTRNIKTIKALLKASPGDFETFGIKIRNPLGVIRLKTYLKDVPDLVRCNYIVPNVDVSAIVNAKYKLVREPIPTGLQKDRYAISYWERV